MQSSEIELTRFVELVMGLNGDLTPIGFKRAEIAVVQDELI